MSRRGLLALAAASAGTAYLTACSSPKGTASPSVVAPAASGAAPESFSFSSWSLTEEAAKPVITGMLNTFAEDKGITIDPVAYPFNEYLNQLTLQVRGNQFNGAMQIDIAWLGTLAALGKLTDLSSFTQGRGYASSALEVGQFNSAQYGLPWTMGAIGLVANKALLDKVGASEVPTTIDDFEALLRELKGIGNGTIPYAASTKVAQLKDVQVWMQTFGSPLVENGKVTVDDDASIEAVTWYKKLYDEGLIAADVDRFDARSLFSQGKAAIYDDAPVGRAAVLKDSPDKELGTKLVPSARPVVKAGDTARALAWGHLIAVVDGAAASTAAEFAQWVTSDEKTVVSYFEALGLPPTTEAGLKSAPVAADTFIAQFSERISTTATSSPLWVYPAYGQIDAAISEQVQAVLVGTATPAEAMAEASKRATALID